MNSEDLSAFPSIKGISLEAVFGEETLPRQKEKLRRAQSEYAAGRYDNARSILKKIAGTLESALLQSAPESADWEQNVRLAASTFTLLGRTYARLRLDDQSVRASSRAVELFGVLRDSKRLSNVEINEFGIALQLAGRIEESIAMLQEATNLGSATPEAHFYLGMYAFNHKDYQDAETYLIAASDMEPDDLQVTRLETLGKILSTQGIGQRDRAIAIYNELSDTLYRLARPEDALAILDRILELDPGNWQAYIRKSSAILLIGHKNEALVTIQQGLKLNPNNAILQASQGIVLAQLGRYQEAVAAYEQAEALGIGDLAGLVLQYKGQALAQLNRYEEAITVLDQALSLDADNAETLGYKGQALAQLNRYEEAITALDQALNLDADNAETLTQKAVVLMQLGRNEEAVAVAEHALELNPNNVGVLGTKGFGLFQLGRYQEAVAAFEQAEALGIGDLAGLVLQYKGQALFQLGRNEEAITVLDQALQLDADNAETLGYKGQALAQLGRNEEAITVLDRALNLDPDNAETLGYKGQALAQLNRYEEAVETLDRAIEIDSKQGWMLTVKGEALHLLGRRDEALEVLDQVLAPEPNEVTALMEKVNILIELEREQEALNALDKALDVDSRNTWILAGKAWVLILLDDYIVGREILQRVLELDPSYAWARGLYGTLLGAIADYEQAIHELNETVKFDSSMGWVFDNLGEACIRLAQQEQDVLKAKELVQQAVDAHTYAVDLNKEDLDSQTRLADAVHSLGEGEKDRAYGIYRQVIEQSKKRPSLDINMTEAVGWCYYRLATQGEAEVESMLTESERLLVESLALRKDKPARSDLIMTKFRLALVILYSGRYQLAIREYENSLSLAREKQVVVQHGIFDQARKDLQEAMRENTILASAPHAKRILTMLQEEYDRVLTLHRD